MAEKLTCCPENLLRWPLNRKKKVSPSYKLPSVQTILSSPDRFSEFFPRQRQPDTPLASLYRIYVAILAGRHLVLRDEIEHFWNQHQWRVCDIPEPPAAVAKGREQRAVLATIPYLLVKAFNRLIERGLPRDAPPIIHDELWVELKSRPRLYERPPRWAELVEPLDRPLVIPDSRGAAPRDGRDRDVDAEMSRKNILTFTLPVFFV